MVFKITNLLLLFLSDSETPLEKKYKDSLKIFIASLVNSHVHFGTSEPKYKKWNRKNTSFNTPLETPYSLGSEPFVLIPEPTANKRLHLFRKNRFLVSVRDNRQMRRRKYGAS